MDSTTIDRRVATEIMGMRLDRHGNIVTEVETMAILWPPDLLPRFSADVRAVAILEERLEQLGLEERYATALAHRVGYDRTPRGAWRLIHATPRERCEAALAAVAAAEV